MIDPIRALESLEWALDYANNSDHNGIFRASQKDFELASVEYLDDVRNLLDEIIMHENAEAGLEALNVSGALASLFPEVHAMVKFGDGEWRHKDVWQHTKQVVSQSVPKLEVRWAALFHDMGKVKTRTFSTSGEVHFFGHAEVGSRMFDKLHRRVPIFTKEDNLRNEIRFLVHNHLRAGQYDKSWTDSAVRRFSKEMGDSLENLMCLSSADITTKRPETKRKIMKNINELSFRIKELEALDAKLPILPKDIGDAIMSTFRIPPSRKIGEMKKTLEIAIESGEVKPGLHYNEYIKFIRLNPGRFRITD